MAAAFVQAKVAAYVAISNGSTFSFTSNVTVGNTIIVMGVHSYAACVPSITGGVDNLGNVYTHRGSSLPVNGGTFETWTAPVVTGGACTITFSMVCSSFSTLAIIEVSGLAAGNCYDQEAITYNGTDSTPSSAGSITPTQNGEYIAIIAEATGTTTTFTAGGEGHTKQVENAAPTASYFDYVQPTAGAFNPSVSWASGVIASYIMQASFKAAGGGGGARLSSLSLLGVG